MFQYQMPLRVYIEDTDAGGIVYYVNYLKFMERARTEWLRQAGFDFTTLYKAHCIFVVKHADIDYISPARMDDLLQVTVSIDKMARTYIRFRQAVRRENDILCEAVLKVGCVDQRTMRPTPMPGELKSVIEQKNNPGMPTK
ncbi:MAG: tol-pal system-associated acyl-CoA thioesterase [Ketobacteraceae bacterium]|nr:tol-pal system-associated acyl-CoA thioesterase [Ketobacteraceae bacterium]